MISSGRATILAAALILSAACAEPVTIADKPVTISVRVPEGVRGAQAILLHLERVSMPKDAPVVLNIFFELPGANATTSVDHPKFAGYVTSLPNSSATRNPPKGFTLQLPEAVARALRNLGTARFTFVPERNAGRGGSTIGSIRLEAVQR